MARIHTFIDHNLLAGTALPPLPITIVCLICQRWIFGGLTPGMGVKG